jgi:hypothetical protein
METALGSDAMSECAILPATQAFQSVKHMILQRHQPVGLDTASENRRHASFTLPVPRQRRRFIHDSTVKY